MFIRFITHQFDKDSGCRQGIFHALGDLRDADIFQAHELQTYNEVYEWFRQNLAKPDRFSRSSKTHAKNVAISWFRVSATEHISKMRNLAQLLEEHSVVVEVLYTERPGYIVYDDEFQVAAVPFKETIA